MSEKVIVDRKKLEATLFNNPGLAAVIAKKQPPNRGVNPNLSRYARAHSEEAATNNNIHDEFQKLFFDLDVAVEIMIGLIVSPKGSAKPELIYGCKYKELPANVIGSIINQLPEYINDTYKLSVALPKLLKKVMYSHGSVVKIIIPESILDRMINEDTNMSYEALNTFNNAVPLKGILQDPTNMYSFGGESHSVYGRTYGPSPVLKDFNLTITDNYDLLAMPSVRKKIAVRHTESVISPFSSDIINNWGGSDLGYDVTDLSTVEALRESIGTPLYLEVDPAAITPIHIPGDPTKHTGYLAILDEHGFIINPKTLKEEMEMMYQELPTTPVGKSIVSMSHLQGKNVNYKDEKMDTSQLISIFTRQINAKLTKMLHVHAQITDLSFSEVNSMYAAILARKMQDKQTKLLFLPPEMVAYYAFKYDDRGIGVTLLNDLPTLSSMRASLLFSGLVAEIKNSIPQTKVNIKLDENDVDPDASLAMIQNNTLERQANLSPIGLVNIRDWTEWAYSSGFSFQVETHPMLPDTKIEYEDVTSQRLIPSESPLHEKIRAQQIMAIGITPEMVDNGFNSDFASTDQAKRIQIARRVTAYQTELGDMLSDEVRKLAKADGEIVAIVRRQLDTITDIKTYLSDKYKAMYTKDKELTLNRLTLDIISTLTVSLPNPDTDNIDVMLASIQKYSEALDLALDNWVNQEFLGGSEEEAALVENITVIRTALKAYFMREFMIKNGFFTQLADITTFSRDGTPAIDLHEVMSAHMKGLIATTKSYLNEFTPRADGSMAPPIDPNAEDTQDMGDQEVADEGNAEAELQQKDEAADEAEELTDTADEQAAEDETPAKTRKDGSIDLKALTNGDAPAKEDGRVDLKALTNK